MLKAEPIIRPLWYLASPYSMYPGGQDAAFKLACRMAAKKMKEGFAIFCPIAHSHPVELYGDTDPSHDFWLGQDIAFLNVCEGMFRYKLPSWENSFGVNWEADWMRAHGKPVVDIEWEGEE